MLGLLRISDQLDAEAATYKTHNKIKRQISMPSKGFEPAISANQEASELGLRPHGVLDRLHNNS